MDHVSVADLKAHLSHYLREVRGGASFVVTSRDMPVAVLGPYDGQDATADWDDLEVIEAEDDPELWGVIESRGLGRSIDVVKLIREDRDGRDKQLEETARMSLRERRGRGGSPQ